jgi:hypothetical protein
MDGVVRQFFLGLFHGNEKFYGNGAPVSSGFFSHTRPPAK